MGDYISKPTNPQYSQDISDCCVPYDKHGEVQSHIAQTTDSTPELAPQMQAAAGAYVKTLSVSCNEIEIFDLAELRARLEDDHELVAEMIDLYLNSSPPLMAEIQSAVISGDSQRICRATHTLKGVVKNMCAERCADAALQLEEIARKSELALADQHLALLKSEFACLQSVMSGVAKESLA
jgi:HPt (histidine-containing phosphotransfer) domain-containing protein